jgi:acyl carrier protein
VPPRGRRRSTVDEELFEKIKDVVAEQLNVEADEIHEDSSFVDDLGADSLDLVELVMALEDNFDMKIPDEDVEAIKTVGDAQTYIESHR